MLVALPCFSRFSARKAALIVSVLGATLLTGCSATTLETKSLVASEERNLSESITKLTEKLQTAKPKKSSAIKIRSAHAKKTKDKIDYATTASTAKSVESFGTLPGTNSSNLFVGESAACRYLRKSSDVEATIIGSPTVSASSDEDGSGSVSIGMNILDLRKANLVRATGDARCRIQTASKEIEATLGVGSEATKFAAAHAKQAYIRNNLRELSAIKSRSNQLVSSGIITKQDANLVGLKINELKAEMEIAKSEADKRRDLPALDINRLRNRHSVLVEATQELQTIERDIRTNDALELSVSTGYRYNDEFNSDLQVNDNDGAFARVNLGVRLGALSSKRQRLEDEAATARHDALFEENTGTIWKSGFAERAIGRVVADLRKSEKEFASALHKANDTIKRLEASDRAEVVRARLQSKIEKVAIGSELAAVRATIKQLEDNRAKIRSL